MLLLNLRLVANKVAEGTTTDIFKSDVFLNIFGTKWFIISKKLNKDYKCYLY